MVNYELTDVQIEDVKKALRSGNWRNLKSWKEKFCFQTYCKKQVVVVEIGKEAGKILLQDEFFQIYKNTTSLQMPIMPKRVLGINEK